MSTRTSVPLLPPPGKMRNAFENSNKLMETKKKNIYTYIYILKLVKSVNGMKNYAVTNADTRAVAGEQQQPKE